jgi:hypothetical protein
VRATLAVTAISAMTGTSHTSETSRRIRRRPGSASNTIPSARTAVVVVIVRTPSEIARASQRDEKQTVGLGVELLERLCVDDGDLGASGWVSP